MLAKISVPSITVNGVIVTVLNEPVGKLGAIIDPNMSMSAHVSKVIKAANYHLRNIGKIRKFLNTDTTKCYAGSSKSKTMLLEWLVAPKSMITLHQF